MLNPDHEGLVADLRSLDPLGRSYRTVAEPMPPKDFPSWTAYAEQVAAELKGPPSPALVALLNIADPPINAAAMVKSEHRDRLVEIHQRLDALKAAIQATVR